MVFNIKVTPGAKRNLVKKEDTILKVYLTAPALDGKANKALVPVLAEYFCVKKSCIEIIKGLNSRHKIISIKDLSKL